MRISRIEKKLWQKIKALPKGPSHNLGHLKRVVGYSLALQKTLGGDVQLIKAAAILHDLGRVDPKFIGKNSALQSARLAKPILKKIGFPKGKIDPVCQIISEHDQPDLKLSTIEARILKEADFLDGFGAWGILRSLLWSGERGEPESEVIRRLREKMPARIKSLEFSESRKNAQKQYYFVQLFLSLLNQSSLRMKKFKGKYLVFEGTSGSGKETQARKLIACLKTKGIEARLVFEPTPDTKPILAKWREEVEDRWMELFFFMADRRKIMTKDVLPALKNGEIVVSVRSWISTLVYQSKNKKEEALISFLHDFVPTPDLILWLDISPKEALQRVVKRHEKTGEKYGKFEKLKKLDKHRKRYRQILKKFEDVVRIDGSPSPERIYQDVLDVLIKQKII